MTSKVLYKLRSNKTPDIVTFTGSSIRLLDLKREISKQKQLTGDLDDFDLLVVNHNTGHIYNDHEAILKNTDLIVQRVPYSSTTYHRNNLKAQSRNKADNSIGQGRGRGSLLLRRSSFSSDRNAGEDRKGKEELVGEEEVDFDDMDSVLGRDLFAVPKGQEYHSSEEEQEEQDDLKKIREVADFAQGIRAPTNKRGMNNNKQRTIRKTGFPSGDLQQKRVARTNVGIPKTFMEEGRALANASGAQNLGQDDADENEIKVQSAWGNFGKDGSGMKVASAISGLTDEEVRSMIKDSEIPNPLKCQLSDKLLQDAVMLPCCFRTCSDQVIQQALIAENFECPLCGKKISIDQLRPNMQLREMVDDFINQKRKQIEEARGLNIPGKLPVQTGEKIPPPPQRLQANGTTKPGNVAEVAMNLDNSSNISLPQSHQIDFNNNFLAPGSVYSNEIDQSRLQLAPNNGVGYNDYYYGGPGPESMPGPGMMPMHPPPYNQHPHGNFYPPMEDPYYGGPGPGPNFGVDPHGNFGHGPGGGYPPHFNPYFQPPGPGPMMAPPNYYNGNNFGGGGMGPGEFGQAQWYGNINEQQQWGPPPPQEFPPPMNANFVQDQQREFNNIDSNRNLVNSGAENVNQTQPTKVIDAGQSKQEKQLQTNPEQQSLTVNKRQAENQLKPLHLDPRERELNATEKDTERNRERNRERPSKSTSNRHDARDRGGQENIRQEEFNSPSRSKYNANRDPKEMQRKSKDQESVGPTASSKYNPDPRDQDRDHVSASASVRRDTDQTRHRDDGRDKEKEKRHGDYDRKLPSHSRVRSNSRSRNDKDRKRLPDIDRDSKKPSTLARADVSSRHSRSHGRDKPAETYSERNKDPRDHDRQRPKLPDRELEPPKQEREREARDDSTRSKRQESTKQREVERRDERRESRREHDRRDESKSKSSHERRATKESSSRLEIKDHKQRDDQKAKEDSTKHSLSRHHSSSNRDRSTNKSDSKDKNTKKERDERNNDLKIKESSAGAGKSDRHRKRSRSPDKAVDKSSHEKVESDSKRHKHSSTKRNSDEIQLSSGRVLGPRK